MSVRPPDRLFRYEGVRVIKVPREDRDVVIQYKDREVEKLVEKIVYRDDPSLLERLNKALKENGELKNRLEKEIPKQQPALKPVEAKVFEIRPNEQSKINIQTLLVVGAVSSFVGALLCYLILK